MRIKIFILICSLLIGSITCSSSRQVVSNDYARSQIACKSVRDISFQVVLNSPDYIEWYYQHISQAMGMGMAEKEQLLARKVNFSQHFLWFNITARAGSMEELVWNECEQFILITDKGARFYPEFAGSGSYPRYRPLEVDGHIYDRISWEKTFGLRFPLTVLCENCDNKCFYLVSAMDQSILGVWEIDKLRQYYKLDDCDSDCGN